MFSKRIQVIFLLCSCFFSNVIFSQEKAKIEFETLETKHFVLHFEKTDAENSLSIDEAGKILEALWNELDKKLGNFLVADEKNTTEAIKRHFDKCRLFLLSNPDHFLQTLKEHHIKEVLYERGSVSVLCNFYSPKNHTIYLCGKQNYHLIRTLVHEATHYYCDVVFPGRGGYYPSWFKETIAVHFDRCSWDGNQLIVGMNPKNTIVRLKIDFVKKRLRSMLDSNPNEILNLGDLGREDGLSDSPLIFSATDDMIELYDFYRVLGGYLFDEHPDIPQKILKSLSNNPSFHSSLTRKQTEQIFRDTCRHITDDAPIPLVDVETWLKKIPFSCDPDGEIWEKTYNGYTVHAGESTSIKIIRLYGNFSEFPVVKVDLLSGKSERSCSGIIINGTDPQNFDLIEVVHNDGSIFYRSKKGGNWEPKILIGQLNDKSNNATVMNYQWYCKKSESTNGSTIDIYCGGEKKCTPLPRLPVALRYENITKYGISPISARPAIHRTRLFFISSTLYQRPERF